MIPQSGWSNKSFVGKCKYQETALLYPYHEIQRSRERQPPVKFLGKQEERETKDNVVKRHYKVPVDRSDSNRSTERNGKQN